MMFRWSVFPRTLRIIALLIPFSLLCHLCLSVSESQRATVPPNLLRHPWGHGQLHYPLSVCTCGCVFQWGGADREGRSYSEPRNIVYSHYFYRGKVKNPPEPPFPLCHFNKMLVCLTLSALFSLLLCYVLFDLSPFSLLYLILHVTVKSEALFSINYPQTAAVILF